MPPDYYTSYIPFITATPKEDFIPVGNTNRQQIGGRKLLPTSRIVLYIAETVKNRTIPFVLVWFCFMLFNLSGAQAQSAETRTAEGQTEIKPLQIGDTAYCNNKNSGGLSELRNEGRLPEILIGEELPKEFWNTSIKLWYSPDSAEVVTFADYKNQLLVLDFWATYCVPCVKSLDKWDVWQKQFRDDVAVLAIHLYDANHKVLPFAAKKGWSIPMVYGNTMDTLLNQLFYYDRSYGQVWIKDGRLFAIPASGKLTIDDVHRGIKGIIPKMELMLTHEEKRRERGTR